MSSSNINTSLDIYSENAFSLLGEWSKYTVKS